MSKGPAVLDQNAPPRLRIAVLGAGAMGSLFGGRLKEGGLDVTLIDRNVSHIEAIRRDGLRLRTDDGDRRIRIEALFPDEAVGPYDLIIVFTKSMHTRAALEAIRRCIGSDTVLLSLQNGLDNKLALAGFVDPKNVLIGVTTYPADLREPGFVESHGPGVARLAAATMRGPGILAGLPEVFARGGLVAQIDPRVEAAIWEKVAFNAALNTLCAITRSTVGEVGADKNTRDVAFAVAREVCATASACGHDASLREVEKTLTHAMAHHLSHKPSMLQDVLAGRPTEVEAICGAVVRSAERHNVDVPTTRALLALVRHIDLRTAEKGESA